MELDKKKRSEISSPDSPALKELCASLHQLAIDLEIPEENACTTWWSDRTVVMLVIADRELTAPGDVHNM